MTTKTKPTKIDPLADISKSVWDTIQTQIASLPEKYTFEAMRKARPSLVELLKTTSKAYSPRQGELRTLADAQRIKVTYLWEPYIPNGVLIAINGDAGSGKTWLSSKLGTEVSTGGTMPHGKDGKAITLDAAPVLLLQKEASLGMTIRPRMEELGGDISMIVTPGDIAGFTFGHEMEPAHLDGFLRLAWYIEALEREYGSRPGFVFIDPIKTFLAGNPNADNEVRPTLERLAAVADFYQVPIIYVLHYNKSEGKKMLYRASGSQEFANVPRVVLNTSPAKGTDPTDKLTANLLIFHQKPLVYTGRNLAYTITGEQDVTPLKWTWTEADQEQSADSLSAQEEEERKAAARASTSKPEKIRLEIIKLLISVGQEDNPKAIPAESVKMALAQILDDDYSDSSYRRAYQNNALGPVMHPTEEEPGQYFWPALQPIDADGKAIKEAGGAF